MAGKSLLLDIDGVIVRDRLLMAHVKENCVSYVRAKLPEAKDHREANRLLYLGYGHTARGLQKGFGVDTRDFNKCVYTKPLMDHLAKVLETDEFQKEAAEIHSLTRDGWNIRLFTNAPWIWAARVAWAIGDDVEIKCPGNPFESPLKPEAEAYRMPVSETNVVMVDDSLKNLGTARYLTDWTCVHFTEEEKNSSVWCPQVQSIWEMCMFLRSNF